MYRTYFFALMLFAMSCTNSTSKVGEDQQSSQQIEYVMNDSLSTDFYTDMKSYVPAEGFIPTADIAVKIAECVLLEIYGKESIEKEKPFSVNLVNGIWVIEGHIPNGNDSALTFCGQSYVEIRKSNGEINLTITFSYFHIRLSTESQRTIISIRNMPFYYPYSIYQVNRKRFFFLYTFLSINFQ